MPRSSPGPSGGSRRSPIAPWQLLALLQVAAVGGELPSSPAAMNSHQKFIGLRAPINKRKFGLGKKKAGKGGKRE